MFLVVLAFAFVACDNTVKTPLGETGLSVLSGSDPTSLSLIDKNGKEVTPGKKYSEIRYIAEDNVIFTKSKDGECLFIDKDSVFWGKTLKKNGSVWQAYFDNKKTAIWDKETHIKTQQYDNIIVGLNQLIVCENGLYGVLDRKGKNILPIEFEKIEVMDDGKGHCYLVYDKKSNLYRRYDNTGKKQKTVYSVKRYEKMKKEALSSWKGGFKVKKI